MEVGENNEQSLISHMEQLLSTNPNLNLNDFEIIETVIGYVNNDKSDPFNSIFFYDKKENNKTFTINKNHFSGLISNKICEIRWHLVYKNLEYRILL